MLKRSTCLFLLFYSTIIYSQPTAKIWDYRFGGTDWELPYVFKQTLDDGFLSGGYSKSTVGFEKTDTLRGHEDYWIVNTNSNGNIIWAKTYGGTEQDMLTSILVLPDSGFLLGGYSSSGIGGDKTKPNCNPLNPGADYWIVRIDKNGNKLWDKTYGGADNDFLFDMIRLPDGKFILGGYTNSDSTVNMSHHNHGWEDLWIIKIDSNGVILWDKNYGSTLHDQFSSLLLCDDGGILLGATSDSPVGFSKTVSPCTASLMDMWVVKVDSNGVKLWDKRIGGPDWDKLVLIRKIPTNKYLFCGYSASSVGCEMTSTTHGTQGYQDFWIVCTDSLFNIIWDRAYGGDLAEDELNNVTYTNNEILITGTSYSSASGDKTDDNILNMEQSWIIAVDTFGNKIWDRIIDNPVHTEYCSGYKLNDGCYVFLSMADVAGGDVFQSRPTSYDYWIVKYCESSALPVADYTSAITSVCQNECINLTNLSQNANSYQWFFPGGSPSSDTATNPQNICYYNSGTFGVTLIAQNGAGSDTLTLPNYITIYPAIQFNPITQNGDTLFSDLGFSSYQWYFDTVPIPGANNYFYVASQSGNYSIHVTDLNGCNASATRLGVLATIDETEWNEIINVNYISNEIKIYIQSNSNSPCTIEIIDLTGKIIATKYEDHTNGHHSIILEKESSSGYYFVNIVSNEFYARKKFFLE